VFPISYGMSQDEKTVLATLAYYHALRVPRLTLSEIFRYRMPFDKTKGSFYITHKAIQSLVGRGFAVRDGEYYALSEFGNPRSRMLKREESNKKRAIFHSVARFFPYIPYVRMVALTGSTALENASSESDIDVLIMSAKNRIWTTRFLVTLMAHFTGKRRYGNKIKNRVCLNHYITERESCNKYALPTSHIYAQALPFWGEERITTVTPSPPRSYAFSSSPNRFLLKIKRIAEIVLNYTIGSMFERFLKNIQLYSINKKINGKNPDLLELIVSEQELRFHFPFSRSKDTVLEYEKILKRHGISCGQHVDNVAFT